MFPMFQKEDIEI